MNDINVRWVRRRVLVATFAAIVISVPALATGEAAISQGFMLEGESSVGTIVSFADQTGQGLVRPTNTDSVERLVGVVGKKQLVELSGGATQTQIVTSGQTPTLVSDINGDIKNGDKITASPINGVGMKALENTTVIGTAQGNFSDASQTSEQELTDTTGAKRAVKVGLLPVQVTVGYYQAPQEQFAFLPSFLRDVANSVAGRTVDPLRVLIALLLLGFGSGGVAVLLYASLRSSIISIGRNPLSAPAVHRSLFEVGAIVIGILLVMLIAVYLVLVM